MLSLTTYINGKFTLITGPVESGKSTDLEGMLDAAVDSGLKDGSNILIFGHPLDDNGADYIGRHKVTLTNSPSDIAKAVTSKTRTVIIKGMAHFGSPAIVHLADALVRSNRNLFATALNLDSDGNPYKNLPDFMAIVDDLQVRMALCSEPGCGSDAIRSKEVGKGKYASCCTYHYFYPEAPGKGDALNGYVELFIGPMASSKSRSWYRKKRMVERSGKETVTFKWIGDTRGQKSGSGDPDPFDIGYVLIRGVDDVPAILVRDAEDIKTYLKEHPEKQVFIDEAQFISGIYHLEAKLVGQGYHFYNTGLPRTFGRRNFGEVPALMCLADKVTMLSAICTYCGHPATDNQRLVLRNGIMQPAHIRDPIVSVDDAKGQLVQAYEPRCITHWSVDGEKPLGFRFPMYRG